MNASKNGAPHPGFIMVYGWPFTLSLYDPSDCIVDACVMMLNCFDCFL